jgi:ABC-type oligopeptide transport system ATPase subunit
VTPPAPVAPLLDVRHLVKEFPRHQGVFGAGARIRAVDDLSFSIAPGEILSVVGESGCGKTTAARCVLRLIEPTSGHILFSGTDLCRLSRRELRRARRNMQMVFQDPFSSLNPRMRAGDIVREPLVIHRVGTRASRDQMVRELFDLVALDPALARRYPHEFSGGQRQRIGIARALALRPTFLVADEPVSALDMAVQSQVVELLLDLQRLFGLTYLFIAHDLRLVREISSRVAVMYRGRFVELAPPDTLFSSPAHPYTRALISAMPRLRPGARVDRVEFSDAEYEPRPLREVGPDHFAAL